MWEEKKAEKVAGSCTIVRTSTPIEAISGGSHSSPAGTSSKEKFLKSNIDFIVTPAKTLLHLAASITQV